MGIHDRKYMNKPPIGGASGLPKTITARFVLICAILFLADKLSNGQLARFGLYNFDAVRSFEIWRLVTPAFFHTNTGVIWVLISFYIFYSLGNFLESNLGSNRFLNLLSFSILGHSLIALFVPVSGMGYFDGIVSSTFLAYGLILGSQKFKLMLFFVLPLTLSGHMLVGFTVALIVLQCFSVWQMGLPMLGGCAAVYIFISQYQMGKSINLFKFLEKKPKPRNTDAKARPFQPNTVQRNFQIVDDEPEGSDDLDAYIQEKVDPILEKIAKSGMSSLTKEEKQILENAKKKMGPK
ncbi:MAG: rhomboid family intramembrane serine protease [Lentisphaeraceae bacterium]|nr:rhomboid family intramembrane serine protease [Lentisphaeraceae bacterium]